jgi:hypothetical protein
MHELRRKPFALKLREISESSDPTVAWPAREEVPTPTSDEPFTVTYSAAEEALKEQETIRIFIARAPGNGHQGASVALMQRLQKLGFKGQFDVVYDDTPSAPGENDGSNPKKLKDLLPGFDPDNPDAQTIQPLGLDVKVRSLSQFQGESAPPVNFGLTGALDKNRSPEDILTKLKVDRFAQLQPLEWSSTDGERGIFYIHEGQEKFHELPELKDLGYIYDDTEPDDPEGMVRGELNNDQDQGQDQGKGKGKGKAKAEGPTDGVLAFLDQSKEKGAHTMLVYGMNTSVTNGHVIGLMNLAKGVIHAQDNGRGEASLGDKGVIIAASGNISEKESSTLTGIFNGQWEGGIRRLFYEDPERDAEDDQEQSAEEQGEQEQESEEDRIQREQLIQGSRYELTQKLKSGLHKEDGSPRVNVIDVSDENAAEAIRGVNPGEVLIVKMGRLPISVFEHMRAKTTLPNGFESVNGVDKERQNKPYFHVGKEKSNRFPESVEGMNDDDAAAAADQNKVVGRQFQGTDSLAVWEQAYGSSDEVETLQAIMAKGTTLTSLKDSEITLTAVTRRGLRYSKADGTEFGLPRARFGELIEKNKQAIHDALHGDDPDKLIGDFLLDTQDPSSTQSQYFNAIKARSRDKDQVAMAWAALVHFKPEALAENTISGDDDGDDGGDGDNNDGSGDNNDGSGDNNDGGGNNGGGDGDDGGDGDNNDGDDDNDDDLYAPGPLAPVRDAPAVASSSSGFTHVPSAGRGVGSTLPGNASSYASSSGTRRRSRSPSQARR